MPGLTLEDVNGITIGLSDGPDIFHLYGPFDGANVCKIEGVWLEEVMIVVVLFRLYRFKLISI